MKKYTYLLGALACSALLAGCSADQDFPAVEGKVRMSVKVGRQQIADALTRITIDEQEGDLVCNWAAGDRLLVVNAAGKNVGYMELAQGEENKNFSQFDGYLVLPEGEQTLNFFYLGKTDVKNYPETAGKYVLDMTSQAGKIANLGDYDMLSSQVKVNVADGWAYSDDLSLQRRIAFAHFQLQMPDGVTLADENVTITGQGVYSKGTYDLTTMATTMTRGTMTVPANGGDFYIDLLPGSDVTPIFAVTVGGVEYEGTLTPKDIQASMFLRKGHQQGVPVQMFRKGGNVDHSLNPLAKWAESNLVFDKSSRTSRETGVATTPGSLYQWGRNTGFADYKAAMGEYRDNNGTYAYGTYNRSYVASEGFWGSPANGDDIVSSKYTSLDVLQYFWDRFFIGDCSIASSGTGITGDGDYWRPAFGDGSGDWNARAAKLNFPDVLAPEGYRLPTRADFRKIFPKDGINSSDNLSSVLTSEKYKWGELRDLDGGHKYAIRWLLTTINGIRNMHIECLMVRDNFTTAELKNIDWTAKEVVKRDFPATGAIEAYTHQHVSVIGNDYQYMPVVRPMPYGTWTASMLAWPSQVNAQTWSMKYINIVDAGKTYEGGYWCADETVPEISNGWRMIFRFRDNTGNFGSYNTISLFGASACPAQNACAVRCVVAD